MFDQYNRGIDYLRVSVTDRCNLRCVYCMPEAGVQFIPREEILSFEEICAVVVEAAGLGITRVRLTGGEPLVRKDIVTLVSMVAGIDEIKDLAMTTNGIRLSRFAEPLRKAGLHRLNISLDTLNAERYRTLTMGGDIEAVLAGIRAGEKAGFTRIKLNCVVERSSDEPDARAVADFVAVNGLEIQFIRRMSMAAGEFWPVEGGNGGHCWKCNRLRLTSNGFVRPCLFSDAEFSVRELGPREAILRAIREKPASGTVSRRGAFYAVGG